MLKFLADHLFGSADDRAMKARWAKVAKINALEPELAALSDEQLAARTVEFRARLAGGAKLDDLVVPAFATVREAARRVLNQRHYDVQLVGGMILHEGSIAEMRTGEGKTLVATLASYLNALEGKGSHVVTVNDYLAIRDSEFMGRVHRFLGLSVGLIVPDLDQEQRRAAYACDITYTTNSELGFDYLRDSRLTSRAEMVQREFHFAIVDEVDSILIDEARTPLVLSGPSNDHSQTYLTIDRFIPRISPDDVEINQKDRSVNLTDAGLEQLERMLRLSNILRDGHLYDPQNSTLAHHVSAALKAHALFQRDKHYMIKGDEILIVDEFTGRAMPGRRFNEGIHQAIEAKERVKIQPETQTIASVTYQNFFREYGKLSGMTGTATTEAEEFGGVYGLPVVAVPTHKPVARKDFNDEIYQTHAEKLAAIIKEIDTAHATLQPILVGTSSIEKSEEVAAALAANGYTPIDYEDPQAMEAIYSAADAGTPPKRFAVLNARYHSQEAFIVAQAGVPGAITIATNMAGRGTDIQLGGNLEMRSARWLQANEATEDARAEAFNGFAAQHAKFAQISQQAGGLYVIGTERNESRRIDNQLRGRSGRQGDPGRSKFFLSITDDVLRLFGNFDKLMAQLDMKPGESLSHPIISRAVSKAQRRFEAHNFEIRKQLLQFDEVVNHQRLAIMRERLEIIDADDVRETVDNMRHEWLHRLIDSHVPKKSYPEQWDAEGLAVELQRTAQLSAPVLEWASEEGITEDELRERIIAASDASYLAHANDNGPDHDKIEKEMLLVILDYVWREHLETLDHLKQVVGWRAIGQRDPVAEFRHDASEAFEMAMSQWQELVTLETTRTKLQKAA